MKNLDSDKQNIEKSKSSNNYQNNNENVNNNVNINKSGMLIGGMSNFADRLLDNLKSGNLKKTKKVKISENENQNVEN